MTYSFKVDIPIDEAKTMLEEATSALTLINTQSTHLGKAEKEL